MKTGLIITGGRLDIRFARSFLKDQSFDRIIAVDGGLDAARKLGMMPDYAVGDFDSLNPVVKQEFEKIPHIIWEVHKPEKDETDTELAVNRAIAAGCEKLVLLGATGGRLDHMLGNLQLLYTCLQKGVDACIVDEKNRVRLIDGEWRISRKEQWGAYVSFLPFTERITGITLTGFRYPLTDKTIGIGEDACLCISNEISESEAVIQFHEGVLVCVESAD